MPNQPPRYNNQGGALQNLAGNTWNAQMAQGSGQTAPPAGQPPAPGSFGAYADPYDNRIGNGALPQGIYGAQNRAYTRDVQGNELAANQLTALLDANNPYILNARRRGSEQAARAGLLTSSIAAGASERSAIEAGAPIALSDANAYRDAAGQNLEYLNQRAIADNANQVQGASIEAGLVEAGMREGGALQRQRENLAFEGEQSGLDRAFTNQRDYNQYQYDSGARYQDYQYGVRSYAQRTGIDMYAQRNAFTQDVARFALANPDIIAPEDAAAFVASWGQVFDEEAMSFDNWFADFGW